MHGVPKREVTRPDDTLLAIRADQYIPVNEGAAGGSIGVLPMTEEAEAASTRIASSASRRARPMPGED